MRLLASRRCVFAFNGREAAARLTEPELIRELALALYQQERLTLAQASGLAEMSQCDFQFLLAGRHIPVHYGIEEFEQDLEILRRMDRP